MACPTQRPFIEDAGPHTILKFGILIRMGYGVRPPSWRLMWSFVPWLILGCAFGSRKPEATVKTVLAERSSTLTSRKKKRSLLLRIQSTPNMRYLWFYTGIARMFVKLYSVFWYLDPQGFFDRVDGRPLCRRLGKPQHFH